MISEYEIIFPQTKIVHPAMRLLNLIAYICATSMINAHVRTDIDLMNPKLSVNMLETRMCVQNTRMCWIVGCRITSPNIIFFADTSDFA